jgi:hypothetical protein
MWSPRLWVLLGSLLLLCGCGSAESPSEVSGIVRFKGKPLRSGTITFTDASGTRKHSPIGEQGNYLVREVSKGVVSVSVDHHPRVPVGLMEPGSKEKTPEPDSEIPARYKKPETSNLTLKVTGGKQTKNFDLEP